MFLQIPNAKRQMHPGICSLRVHLLHCREQHRNRSKSSTYEMHPPRLVGCIFCMPGSNRFAIRAFVGTLALSFCYWVQKAHNSNPDPFFYRSILLFILDISCLYLFVLVDVKFVLYIAFLCCFRYTINWTLICRRRKYNATSYGGVV